MSATPVNAMVWLVATQFLLYAVGWLLCALPMREQRPTIVNWAGFMGCIGAGFALSAQRDDLRAWGAYCGADLLFTLGLMSLWRGLAGYLELPLRHREHALLAAVALAGLLLLGPGRDMASWRVLFAYGINLVVMVRLLMQMHPGVKALHGPRVAAALLLPGGVTTAAFLLAIARQASHMELPLEVHRIDANNLRALFIFIGAAAIFNFIFIALLTHRMLRRLHDLSRRDALTGLVNRRALDEDLLREWQRWRRHGQAFAVMQLDLDHFKRVNDTHGHAAGDAVLEQTGLRLRGAARLTDTVARTGGEEFVVLVPQAQGAATAALAERLRASVAAQAFDLPGLRLPLTVSVGVAVVGPLDTDLQQVLRRADQALYRAKAQGRNRVVMAGDPPAATLPVARVLA